MPDKLYRELADLTAQARGILIDYDNLGIDGVFLPEPGVRPAGEDAAGSWCPAVTESLESIREDLGDCQRCKLARERNRIVFGVGNPRARLVLVGEGPGREEDRRGEPFVGEAGQLLDRILAAMGLDRSQVYICNVVKCRPPGNRDPEEDEISACEPFLLRQLKVIEPEVIMTLGRYASQTLLRQTAPMGRLRGHWHSYQGIPVMPTWHPAYLLRNPEKKREVWEDVKLVLHRLG
ncbi:MAG: uracil-DNA glycosylase [Deltaproteobacteria bacterium]|nr:MAG: uracil-DNA glycosylase [Deltaproteobacteria bacterium]